VTINFAIDGNTWNEDLVLQRYERVEPGWCRVRRQRCAGQPMHTTIAASGDRIARLRGKIKYGRWCSN